MDIKVEEYSQDGYWSPIPQMIKEEEECILETFSIDNTKDPVKEEEKYLLENDCTDYDTDNQFSCYHCSEEFNKLRVLRSHIKKKHIVQLGPGEDLKFHLLSLLKNPNSVCKYINPVSIRRKKHKVKQKEFQCLMCDYRTEYKGNMKRHKIAIHSIQKYHHCPQCNYKSYRSDSLKDHVMRNHPTEKPVHRCSYCDYEGLELRFLRRHVRNVHESKQILPKYQCFLCEYRSNDRYEVNRHMIRKHCGKKHTCSKCHSGKKHKCSKCYCEKEYKCTKCKYNTSYAVDLKRHIASRHTNDRPYECNLCFYKTAIPGHLKRHMRGKKHQALLMNKM